MERILLTSESVTGGHPDKVCDQISDAVLDEVIRQDRQGRVACETFITVGLVIVGGEITTTGYADLADLVRKLLADIGYTNHRYGFDAATCAILNVIGRQSPDIAQGVDRGGAGDQGLMVGYACSETPELMPMPIMLAHKLCRRLAEVRKQGVLGYLGPDGKSQVTVEYVDGKPRRISNVVISSQHTDEILDETGHQITEEARNEMIEKVIKPILPTDLDTSDVRVYVNPTGKFVIGGPQSDTGMTGRKIIVDTYGGAVPHGGGAFSGKDPTKVDRSATYFARWIAKNVVAADLADRIQVNLAYVIGEPDPASVSIDTFGTGKIDDDKLLDIINAEFDFRPRAIIERLDLLRPIYRPTAAYGHFGRNEDSFSWEKLDAVDALRSRAGE
ncbi:methionine adenosyltransferase [candidate division WOR-3 bacterium]|nr:methionine adenosyltransferase [candidate division WOR-3 bacterium]